MDVIKKLLTELVEHKDIVASTKVKNNCDKLYYRGYVNGVSFTIERLKLLIKE